MPHTSMSTRKCSGFRFSAFAFRDLGFSVQGQGACQVHEIYHIMEKQKEENTEIEMESGFA